MKKIGRKKIMVILLSIIGVMIIFSSIVVLTSLYVNNPTKGEPIAQYENSKSALLVIDVQNDTTSNTGFYGNTSEFVESVNQAIIIAEENNMEILYIKNEYGRNPIIFLLSLGKYREGTEGAELDNRLLIVNENIFSKSIGDSFSSAEFENYLISKKVDTLYIIGADAAGCVYSTAQGGLNRKYSVNIIEEAIITVNEKTMSQMIEKYDSDGIGVIDLAQFNELK